MYHVQRRLMSLLSLALIKMRSGGGFTLKGCTSKEPPNFLLSYEGASIAILSHT